jgi:hypothetical protein
MIWEALIFDYMDHMAPTSPLGLGSAPTCVILTFFLQQQLYRYYAAKLQKGPLKKAKLQRGPWTG